MLQCEGCHRFVHATETSCPFCAAPGLARGPMVAFAAGLSLLACTDPDDDVGETNEVTSQETLDYSGSDYGGPPPCEELDTALPIVVGSNPVDTTMSGDGFSTSCGDQLGTGSDRLLQFIAPAAGNFTFTLTGANFDAWLLQSNSYCYASGEETCVPNLAVDIDLVEGDTLYLILDSSTDGGGTASVDVTQG
jgi:hypothetical protein